MNASSLRARYRDLLVTATALLVVRVTVAVVAGYRDYLPPDFSRGFLIDRESHFTGLYRLAFYAHIAAGPPTLLLALGLLAGPLRRRFPRSHRIAGRVQAALVLLLLVPSGVVMSFFPAAGPVAGASLLLLAVATAATMIAGVRAAVRRRYRSHERWMTRCAILLGSAVVLRVLGGLGQLLHVTAAWYDPAITWAAWTVPLAGYEVVLRLRRGIRGQGPGDRGQGGGS